jgi:hypothetical protein
MKLKSVRGRIEEARRRAESLEYQKQMKETAKGWRTL